jgi:hypothetical protein
MDSAIGSIGSIGSVELTTEYALEEKKKLKKSISRLDILFFLLCTIVGFDTIGSTAAIVRPPRGAWRG